jgi:hypothetical protein
MAGLLDNPPDRASVRAAAANALSVERMTEETTAVYRRLLSTGRAQ